MYAAVNLKLTPKEFDVMRKALVTHRDAKLAEGDDIEIDPKVRREAKAEALLTDDLMRKVN